MSHCSYHSQILLIILDLIEPELYFPFDIQQFLVYDLKIICMYIHTYIYIYIVHIYVCAAAKSLQLCPTLCNPRDGNPPGSPVPVPGILQARTMEWVAISFSNA